jgi:hypothetical protein
MTEQEHKVFLDRCREASEAARGLKMILDSPEPGLISWCMALGRAQERVNQIINDMMTRRG